MQVSYNKLKTFGQCPLKYRLTYVEKVPRPPLGHLAFNRRIHSVLRVYHDLARLDGVVRVDDLLKIYDEHSGADREPQIRDGEEYREGEEILRLYCERENRKGRIPAHLEHKIRAPFGPYTLTGAVDRIDLLPDGGYSIVDYKLDRKLPPANPAAVDQQLSFYQLLVHEGLGWLAEDVRLYYLRHGVEKTASRTKAALHDTTEWIDETADKIRNERRWQPCEGDACKSCAFWKMCPAKTGKPREQKTVWNQASFDW